MKSWLCILYAAFYTLNIVIKLAFLKNWLGKILRSDRGKQNGRFGYQYQQGKHTGVLSKSWLSEPVGRSDTFSGSPVTSSDSEIGAWTSSDDKARKAFLASRRTSASRKKRLETLRCKITLFNTKTTRGCKH